MVSLGGISDEAVAGDAAEELGIDAEEGPTGGAVGGGFVFSLAVEIEVDAGFEKCGAGELANGGGGAGGEEEIVRDGVLEGEPHGLDVFRGITPIAFGIEISELKDFIRTGLDPSDGGGDLTGHEAFSAARRARRGEEFTAEVRREDGFSRKKARKYAKRRVGRVWGGREALRTTKCRFGASKRDLP